MSFADATTRFSTKAEVYSLARPRYPREVVSYLETEGVIAPGKLLADLGSGTGLSAEPFLDAGYTVIGIEPNDPMRLEGDSYLKRFPHFRSVKGTSEATTLPDHSVGAVIAAQAFHWFNIDLTRTEMQRILRRPGYFVAMWNHRNHNSSDLQRSYEAILRKFCPEYHKLADLYRSPARSTAFFIEDYQDATLLNPQKLTWPHFEARILSSSYIPKPEHPDFAPFMAEMKGLFEKHAVDGVVQFDLEIWIHWGRLI